MTLRKIMECSSILLLSLTMINFNAIAAKKSDRATEPATAKMPKVEICHQDQDTGLFHAINISQKAADKHLANHGDAYPETQFADGDGDGYGNEFASDVACPTPGFVTDNTDCEDNNFDINPGVDEIPGDGLDNDCDIDTDDEFHSCQGLLNAGYNTDGVYTLLPEGAAGAAMDVYCDMTTDGGGWTLMMQYNSGKTSLKDYLGPGWSTYANHEIYVVGSEKDNSNKNCLKGIYTLNSSQAMESKLPTRLV